MNFTTAFPNAERFQRPARISHIACPGFATHLRHVIALRKGPSVRPGSGRQSRRLLSHGGWRTVLCVLPVVVLGAVASAALEYQQITALGTYPPPHRLVVNPAAFLAGVLQDTLTAVLLYVAYRLSSPGPVHADHEWSRTTGAAALTAPRQA